MMKRVTMYLGLAFAACLSCFSIGAFAEPIRTGVNYAAHYLSALAEPQGVAMQRLDLTLAMWRTCGQPEGQALKSNLRASSNHFVITTFKASPDGVGLTPC
ncbi:hypothetical protein [Pseudomonas sp. OV226]|uniref:hypothetical protein n=1 Tax=Pseudomonas sp. OV226 TaxID=2135588 RepID=UPI000D6D2AAB|nr:hypothetical protein [Pseudomonas sp. OV226]PWK31775.1 hypothetical protein C7534_12234 [Pseudomonas sp. OV226]